MPRAMERSKKDIKPSTAKTLASNRHDCADKGQGMGGTAEDGNKEAAWKPGQRVFDITDEDLEFIDRLGGDYGLWLEFAAELANQEIEKLCWGRAK